MADWPAKKNSAFTVTFPIYDADGDLVTAAGSLDSEVSKDNGTFADVSPGEAVEVATSSGVYYLALSATEMNADIVCTITKSTGGKTAVNVMYTVTRQLVDMAFPVTSGRGLLVETDNMVHADLKEWLGTAPATLAATFVQTDLQNWRGSVANGLTSGRVECLVGAMGANVLTATAINADAITAAKVAADVHAEAADAVWDEDVEAAHGGDAAAGLLLRALGADITNRTNTQTLEGLLGIADAATTYLPDSIWDEARAGHVGAGSFGEGVASVQGNVTGSVASVTGAVGSVTGAVGSVTGSVGSIAAGGIASTSFVAGAINAAAIAANAIEAAKINTGAITAAKFAASAITSTVLADDAITAAKLAANASAEIADGILSRDVDQVESTAPVHSLCSAILKGVSRIRDNAGTLEVYRTNGSTIHMSQTITVDSGLDPIDELTAGV